MGSDNDKQLIAKMKLVAAEMSRLVTEPAEKQAINAANIFVIPRETVGIGVPRKLTNKLIMVSFAQDYFQKNDINTLAKEGLEDFYRASITNVHE